MIFVLGVVSLAASLGAVASFGYAYNRFSDELPEIDDYQAVELAQTSVVYDWDGEPVDELYGVQNRYVVPRDGVSDSLREAVVAIEDNRFYRHDGLDFEAIGRAAVSNVRNFSVQEGGSTITQQLIKNTYIDQELRAVPSVQRKINEAALAWQYEDEHTKDEILNQYLNTVYFGKNAYGAEAASRTYFDKSADELELGEAAMLAGIINLPSTYDPFAFPKSARKRRDVVLDKMLAQGRISEAEYQEAVSSDLGVNRGELEDNAADDYFLNAVRQEIIREYGQESLYQGGLDIYTTLDPELQSEADAAVEQIVNPDNGDPSASLVSIEPSTGAVRAMVGGSDFDDVQFNLATQAKRQPGSTFKMFVLAEAIKQGISLDTVYESKFLQIPLPESDEVYEVDNYDSIRRGEIDLRTAIAQSDNTVFVQLALDLGMERVIETAEAMGIQANLEPYPATAIGGLGEGVSPQEMASAYSTLPNGGVHAKPYLVREVKRTSDGQDETLEEHEAEEERVLSEDEAALMNQALKGVVEEGTASYYRDIPAEIGRESAGKTGTTDAFIDAWYVGYVPQLTTSVWVGYPTERRSMVNIRGYEEINGENFPLDIWSVYMQNVVGRYPVQQFAEPSEEFLEGLREDKVGIPPDEREDAETTAQETTASETTASETTSESTNSGGDTEDVVQGVQDFLDSLESNRTEPAVSPERQRRQQPQQPQQQRQQQRQQQPEAPQRSGAGANQPGVQPNVAPQNANQQRPNRDTRPGAGGQRNANPQGAGRRNQPATR
ncbi:PBP1A family penicillin-binding protein [soil metagenome]